MRPVVRFWRGRGIRLYVTQFVKPDIMMHFLNPDFCISEFYIPKALFYSNINVVLQIVFELQG